MEKIITNSPISAEKQHKIVDEINEATDVVISNYNTVVEMLQVARDASPEEKIAGVTTGWNIINMTVGDILDNIYLFVKDRSYVKILMSLPKIIFVLIGAGLSIKRHCKTASKRLGD